MSFDGNAVLRDISFEVEPGEILCIMGSSGGGKTTLLRCISGLIRPTEGSISVDGIDVVRDPNLARTKLGLVFQYAALFDYLSVFDNVAFGARRQSRRSRRDLEQLVKEYLEEVGLADKENLMPAELSGGMKKRVGLARALAMNPEIILYDEPTSGLDPVTAYAIDQLIVETRNRRQVASVVVSHDVSSVYRVADRIAFLDKGDLRFLGTPDAFRADPDPAIRELVELSRTESLPDA